MAAKYLKSGVLTAGLSFLAATGQVRAGEPKEKECLECHPRYYDQLKGKHNHAPFQEKDCWACHEHHGYRGQIALKGTVFDLCTSCHAEIAELPHVALHGPLNDNRSCLECHLPHSADNELLLSQPGSLSCFQCHDQPPPPGAGVHQPYSGGQCLTCHDPHGSLFTGFMKLPPGFICLDCHYNVIEGYTPPEMHSGDGLHSCEQCHEPHESATPPLLKEAPKELCFRCHTQLAEQLRQERPHTIVASDDCLVCHRQHFQKGTLNLIESQRSLCLGCHSEIQEALAGANAHATALDEDCTICHDPHAGVIHDTEPDLCAGCHDVEEQAFLARHAGIVAKKCTGCHDAHGSGITYMIKPVQHPPFEERQCVVCHEDRGQDDLVSPIICLECHDRPATEGAHASDLVQEKRCVSCHNPHASRWSGLLRARPD